MKLSELLFKITPTPIGVCPEVVTGKFAPSDYGVSKHHSGRATAKTSAAALCLEELFGAKISSLDGETFVIVNEEKYIVNHRNLAEVYTTIMVEPKKLLVPILATAISMSDELTEVYNRMKTQYLDSEIGRCEPRDVFLFCDSFYYGFAKENEEEVRTILISDAELSLRSAIFADASTATPEKVALSTSPTDVLARAKAGEYRLGIDWGEENIPSGYLDAFVPTKAFVTALNYIYYNLTQIKTRLDSGIENPRQIIGANATNIRLFGDPGTGKSMMLMAVAEAIGFPVYIVKCDKNSENDTFSGLATVTEDGIRMKETPFLRGFKNGGLIIVEEFNLADANVAFAALGEAIYSPFKFYENGHKEITRNPYCLFSATYNVGTAGSMDTNEALKNRLLPCFEIKKLEDNDITKVLRASGASAGLAEKILTCYKRITSLIYAPETGADDCIKKAVSIRNCLATIQLVKAGIQFKEAALMCFGTVIKSEDIFVGEKVEAVINGLPD